MRRGMWHTRPRVCMGYHSRGRLCHIHQVQMSRLTANISVMLLQSPYKCYFFNLVNASINAHDYHHLLELGRPQMLLCRKTALSVNSVFDASLLQSKNQSSSLGILDISTNIQGQEKQSAANVRLSVPFAVIAKKKPRHRTLMIPAIIHRSKINQMNRSISAFDIPKTTS